MNDEQTVQVVAQGVVCIEEQNYRQAFQRMLESVEAFRAVQRAVAAAWLAEHYPMMRCRISSVPVISNESVHAGVIATIENVDELPCPASRIQAELDAYLRQLEGR